MRTRSLPLSLSLSLALALTIVPASAAFAGAGDGESPRDDGTFGASLFSRCMTLSLYGAAAGDPVCAAIGALLSGGMVAPAPAPTPVLPAM